MRWQITHQIPAIAMRREEMGAEDLEEEPFEGQMALPGDLLVLDAPEI
jgi:hypothetical protein